MTLIPRNGVSLLQGLPTADEAMSLIQSQGKTLEGEGVKCVTVAGVKRAVMRSPELTLSTISKRFDISMRSLGVLVQHGLLSVNKDDSVTTAIADVEMLMNDIQPCEEAAATLQCSVSSVVNLVKFGLLDYIVLKGRICLPRSQPWRLLKTAWRNECVLAEDLGLLFDLNASEFIENMLCDESSVAFFCLPEGCSGVRKEASCTAGPSCYVARMGLCEDIFPPEIVLPIDFTPPFTEDSFNAEE